MHVFFGRRKPENPDCSQADRWRDANSMQEGPESNPQPSSPLANVPVCAFVGQTQDGATFLHSPAHTDTHSPHGFVWVFSGHRSSLEWTAWQPLMDEPLARTIGHTRGGEPSGLCCPRKGLMTRRARGATDGPSLSHMRPSTHPEPHHPPPFPLNW